MVPRIFTALLWSATFLAPGLVCAQPSVTSKLPTRLLDFRGASFDLRDHFAAPESAPSLVQVATPYGIFSMELLEQDAPLTVANFRAYVQAGAYRNALFHRSVPGFVIQTGGFSASLPPVAVTTRSPVTNEFRVPNTRGTVAMAKLGSNPNSATSQWFVNLADNRANLDNQNGGFTVFARVLGNGMKVVDALAAVPAYDAGAPFDQIPLRGIRRGQTNVTEANLLPLDQVFIGPFAVRSSNPEAWSASLDGSVLRLRPGPSAARPATVTVRAADIEGRSVTSSFVVKSAPARRYCGIGEMNLEGTPVYSQIDITPSGSFSGVLQAPGRPALRGSGVLNLVSGAELVVGPDTNGTSLVLAYVPGQDLVRARFRTNSQDHSNFELRPVAWPSAAGVSSPINRRSANALLNQGATGYLQLAFDRAGQAKLTGRLADNSIVTGSFPLVVGDDTGKPLLPLGIFPKQGAALALAGTLQLDLPGHGDTSTAPLRGTLRRLPRSAGASAELAARGSFWTPPLPRANALNGITNAASSYRFSVQSGLPGTPMEFDSIWPSSNRPATAKGSVVNSLRFNSSTGLLTGRVLAESSPGVSSQHPFFGVLTGPLPGLDPAFRGAGFVAGPASSSAAWTLTAEQD